MLAVKLKFCPVQTGELLPAEGADGVWLIVTEVVPTGPVHPFSVAVTEYIPDASVVTLAMVGFCEAEVKLLGPFHE